MNAQQWNAAKSLLLKAAALPADTRAAFLEQQCPDVAVRAELLAMLANPAALSDVLAPPVLTPGTILGSYVVEQLLGAGGMGQVYRARDTKLARDVAIKILPADVANDPERLRRFAREAQLLAAVNHPHIAAVHGLDDADGVRFLVMELIDGPSLAERLGKGALKAPEALRVATEIAEGLQAAHRAGITHRDLKPANVMLGRSGVKLVDFGLAKATRGELTLPGEGTIPGTIVGTLPYMAPEQVDGRATDARTDIFAFGCVLYETLTGTRPFTGSTPFALAAAILEHEPAPITVTPDVPLALKRVVARCLAKQPDDRWQTATDLLAELGWIANASSIDGFERKDTDAPRGSRRMVLLTGVLVGTVLGAAGFWSLQRSNRQLPSVQVVHSEISVAPAEEVTSAISTAGDLTLGGSRRSFDWTPDGQSLLFVGRRAGVQQIYIRPLNAPEAHPLPGTERAVMLAVSPDGRSAAFAARGWLKTVPLGGGPATEVTSQLDRVPMGLTWGSDGRLFFTGNGATIWEAQPGRPARAVTTLRDFERAHIPSSVLPRDRALLYTGRRREWTWGDEEVVALDLATGQRTVLLHDAADARYVSPGYLLFMRRGTLMVVQFDPASLLATGSPVPVIDGVSQALIASRSWDATGIGQFSVSSSGSLAFIAAGVSAGDEASLVSVDLSGHVSDVGAPVRPYGPVVRASPDGDRLAITIATLGEVGLWLYDLRRPGALLPLHRTGEMSSQIWSPEGGRIVFKWLRDGRYSLATQRVDGTSPPIVVTAGDFSPSTWGPGGQLLGMVNEHDVAVATGSVVKPIEHLQRPGTTIRWPEVSPDGHWLAYAEQSGPARNDIYVESYPGPGPRLQISVDGGQTPAWHPGGREVFYVKGGAGGMSTVLAVPFVPGSPPRAGRPRMLFDVDPGELAFSCQPLRCYDVAPDGRRFYAVRFHPSRPPHVTHVNVVQNWLGDLKSKVPEATPHK